MTTESAGGPPVRKPAWQPHWLLVPAFFVSGFGLLAILGNAALLAFRFVDENEIPWRDVPAAFRFWEIELRVVAILAGLMFVCAGLLFAFRRWKAALVLIGLAVVVSVMNKPTNQAFRSHFAGDSYLIRPGERAAD